MFRGQCVSHEFFGINNTLFSSDAPGGSHLRFERVEVSTFVNNVLVDALTSLGLLQESLTSRPESG
ncbi:MAG TPA: hypothetical protein VJ984_06810 [Xanthomonadales bacterium]|nr:hypothetical protein [Xanthomonadales bacterium]